MTTKKTTQKAKAAKTKTTKSATPKAKPAKTLYRVSEANEGRQLIGDYPSAALATNKAQAHMAKHAVPVEVARGKIVGSAFQAEFTEVLQPEIKNAAAANPVVAEAAAVPAVVNAATNEPAPAAKVKRTPKAKPAAPAKDKRLSALDAAAKVLTEAGQSMSTPDMITAMAAKGYWSSPNGKTPHATLYAAILREINTKGTAARFTKTDRGRFAAK